MFLVRFFFTGAYEVVLAILAVFLGVYCFVYYPWVLTGLIDFNQDYIVPPLLNLFREEEREQARLGAEFFNIPRVLIISEILICIKLVGLLLRYLIGLAAPLFRKKRWPVEDNPP
jgi:hypothetical protein